MISQSPESGKREKKILGPPCTDNFQIIRFEYLGKEWWSVEQCYQALKFSGDMKDQIWKATPFAGESKSAYGMRVWSMGQRGRNMVLDWENKKLQVMFLANVAKYASNPELQQELVEETKSFTLVGGPSTWEWSKWNGKIQMKIRSLIVEGIPLDSVKNITKEELEGIGTIIPGGLVQS